VPNPGPFRDSLIAATALVHNMTLVTRNVADFQASGVPLINPWDCGDDIRKNRKIFTN
jgi:predicted nucleic acid-binding protein